MKLSIATVAVTAVFVSACAVYSQTSESSKVVEEGFRKAESICRDVEIARSLKFKEKVKAEVQTKEDFVKFVRKSIEEQYGRDEAKWFVRALVRMGLLEKEMDLTDTLVRMLESQAAAHYDPETKKCYLLIADMNAVMLDLILSHELCHALQDQHFNLYDLALKDVKAMRDNGDEAAAKACLFEGDATYVMMAWMVVKQAGVTEASLADPMVSMAINVQGAMDYDAVINMADSNVDKSFGGLAVAMQEMKDMPRYFMQSMYATYVYGAMMVDSIKTRGGWAAVNALYKNPPQSTEQVLHPKKLFGRRDVPVDVRMPELKEKLPSAWILKEEDVLGELGVKILFELWADKKARDPVAISAAADGWGGDRYYYLVNAEADRDLLVWKTVWDSSGDAGEFITFYRLLLSARFPKMQKAGQSKPGAKFMFQVWEVEPGRFLKLVRNDTMVGIVDSTDRSCLDVFWK